MPAPIQILAIEAQTALGSLSETHDAIEAGTSALQTLDAQGHPDRRGATLPGLGQGEDDPALRILGRHGRALEPVLHAVHAAGHGPQVARERLGLFLALGMVDAEADDLVPAVQSARDTDGAFSLRRFFGGAFRSIHPLWPLAMLNNVAAGQFAIDLDVRGDNLVLASDADAGVRAVLEAARSIQGGAADAALVAGAAETVGPFGLARLALEGRPTTHSPGEGAGAWLLASSACAHAIGARAVGFVRGGATAFGKHPETAGSTQAAWLRAITAALADAHCEAVDVIACDPHDEAANAAAATIGSTPRWSPQRAIGNLGTACAFVEGALALHRAEPASTILLLCGGASGCAGALVLEAAA